MRIPDSAIDDVRLASDIVEVISPTVRLKKRGKNYLGLCPFHTEKTPSFTVSAEKQMFHCFGCGTGGNVFTFLMRIDKVPFPEAVRTLAERAGITLPQTGGPDTESVHEPLYTACRRAGMYFYDNLFRSPEGDLALRYFHKRGFSDETIRTFGLGCSLNSWDGLLRFGREEGIEPATLEKAGLVVRRDDGSGFYDRFRGRAMFPILSAAGKTIGFGARKLRDDDPLAKYINSPETPVYDKSRVLYGLSQTKDEIRSAESALLVEGYADLLSLYQAGIRNVVASSGTALTDQQIRLIGRYSRNIVLVYDADSAGSKAMMKGVDLIVAQGFEVRVVSLPQGEDPDSFVRNNGADDFRALADKAMNFLDFKVEQFRAAGLLASPEGQTRAVRSIVRTIATMKDELKRNLYIKHLSETYGIYESVLFRELEKQEGKAAAESKWRPEKASEAEEPVSKTTVASMPPVDRDLLKVMIENGPRIIELVATETSNGDFSTGVGSRVFSFLLERARMEEPWDPAGMVDDIRDDEVRNIVTELLFNKYEISKGWEARDSAPEEVDPELIVTGCLELRQRERLEREIADNQKSLRAASARGEDLKPYLLRHRELLNRKHRTAGAPAGQQ
ncbi:MAG: DNA primase [Ignavibacteria bacterium]|nr:DNA primase [Ignavibacteria bacterium]